MSVTGIATLVLSVVGGAKILEQLSATPHQKLQKKAVHTAYKSTSSDADIFADHIEESNISRRKIDGHTDGVIDDVEGKPDFVIQDFPTHIVAEVEDADGLQDVDHVMSQLRDYTRPEGYTTLLVVPDEEETISVGNEITERVESTVHVTTPSNITEFL